jgi:nucleoside triphosphate pyrophosphatase
MSDAPVVVLASASPRRTQLLQQIGVTHRVVPADIEERREAGESPEQCVIRLARSKASWVRQRMMDGNGADSSLPVLGADTAVVIDDDMLGKPRDRSDALAMLQRLAARTHQVLSAVALAGTQGVTHLLSCSEVRFRALSERECAAYWESGEPRDKAGAYAIQGRGALFVEWLTGSFSGVMGLPLFETAQLLSAYGVVMLDSPRARR